MDLRSTTPVRIVNKTDEEFVFKFERDKYRVSPNSEIMLPWNVVKFFLGDPTVTNEPGQPKADIERKRAQTHLGAPMKNKPVGPLHNPIEWDKWKDMMPNIETYTVDGDRIKMAFEIPHNTEDFQTGFTEKDMKQKIAEMQATIDAMRLSMEQDDRPFVHTETALHEEQVTTMDELPEDHGPSGPSRRGIDPDVPIG